jgi:hypothetical protein
MNGNEWGSCSLVSFFFLRFSSSFSSLERTLSWLTGSRKEREREKEEPKEAESNRGSIIDHDTWSSGSVDEDGYRSMPSTLPSLRPRSGSIVERDPSRLPPATLPPTEPSRRVDETETSMPVSVQTAKAVAAFKACLEEYYWEALMYLKAREQR